VQVIPPKKSKKRKGVTLDLSAPAPATKRRTGKTDVKAVQDELKSMVEEIRQYKKEEYTVTIHKEFASFVKKVLPLENVDEWQPREDPKFGRLLNAMKKRIPVFKDSAAQRVRLKAMEDWQQEMAFIPSLDLKSFPPKKCLHVSSSKVPGLKSRQELQKEAKPVIKITNAMATDTSQQTDELAMYFQPLVEATTKFFAAVAATKNSAITAPGVGQCNDSLRRLSSLGATDDHGLSRGQGIQLEELLNLIRLVMYQNANFRKKAKK